jgi:hypothetical protein
MPVRSAWIEPRRRFPGLFPEPARSLDSLPQGRAEESYFQLASCPVVYCLCKAVAPKADRWFRHACIGDLGGDQIGFSADIARRIRNACRAISGTRCITFRWKDYRAGGRTRYKTMTLAAYKFMGRFLLHVLPGGSRRIRHD